MKRLAAFVLLTAMLVTGSCDVALSALLLEKNRDDSGDTIVLAPTTPPPPPGAYKVWIAPYMDDLTADAQKAQMILNNGEVDELIWTDVGASTVTATFDLTGNPAVIRMVMIQANNIQDYDIDAIERLSATDLSLEVASAPTWADKITSEANVLGPVDAQVATTAATAGAKAFVFVRFTADIQKVRICLAGASKSSGDLEWLANWGAAGYNQTPYGCAVNAAGTCFVTVSDQNVTDTDIILVPFSNAGAAGASVLVANGTTITGGHGVAVGGVAENVFLAYTNNANDVIVNKYAAAPVAPPVATRTLASSGLDAGPDRVEPNGITVDGGGNVVVAMGQNVKFLIVNDQLDHFIHKLDNSLNPVGGSFPVSIGSDTTGTYWYAAAVGPLDRIATAGNYLNGGANDAFFRLHNSDGSAPNSSWTTTLTFGDGGQTPHDLGQAVAIDSGGNVIVGGYFGTNVAVQGRNAFIAKFDVSRNPLWSTFHTGEGATGDEEVLDLAVDPSDDSVFAVGYETITGQGENWWIAKYASTGGQPLWTRSYHGGFGNDRAVGVAVSGSSIVVVGYQTVTGGTRDVHVRKYVK